MSYFKIHVYRILSYCLLGKDTGPCHFGPIKQFQNTKPDTHYVIGRYPLYKQTYSKKMSVKQISALFTQIIKLFLRYWLHEKFSGEWFWYSIKKCLSRIINNRN